MQILQYLINGISIGAVYAIIALGYTMVYGIAKMLNFAHGDVIMVGAYISFCVTNYLGLPAIVSILAAMVVCTVLGIVIEGLAYKPLRGTSSLAVLITAIGVSYFLQNAAQLIWTSNSKNFTSVVTMEPIRLFDGQLLITGEVLLTISVSVLVMIGLTLFTGKTRTGKAMRAVAEDRAAAQLMGINVNRTISMTFAIGSALAAIAGILMCSTIKTLMPTTGSMPGIRAFTAAVFGGIGSIPGAMLGGILLGMVESISYKITAIAPYTDAIEFSLLIIILLVRPTGFLGKKRREKV
jgi:branched-chain amino acid transport system permease protein